VANQPILAGYNLVLIGSQLKGEDTIVIVGDIEVTPAAANVLPEQIIVPIPASLEAGTQSVQVVQRVELGSPPSPHRGVESNVSTFTLSPAIANVTASGGTLNLTIQPPVGATQRVTVLLNQSPPASSPPLAYALPVPTRLNLASPPASPPPPSPNLSLSLTGIASGSYLVRVQVDDSESPLDTDSSGQFAGPQVNLP
jgi:hypothetical protein